MRSSISKKFVLCVCLFLFIGGLGFAQFNRATLLMDDVKLIGTDGSETVYEDAEDGLTTRWHIIASIPGAEVNNIYSYETASRVIDLVDNDTNSVFTLTKENFEYWDNTTQFTLEYSMYANVNFQVYVRVITEAGTRELLYSADDFDRGYMEWYYGTVHHGLGSYIIGSGWFTITRDLQADLSEYLPGETIQNVMLIKIRRIGDYIPPEPPTADAHTIGFWKNNIRKAIQGKRKGFQIDKETLESLLASVRQFSLTPFNTVTLESAYDILSAKGPDAIDLLKKQLLAAELSYFNGARIPAGTAATENFLEAGEDMLLDPEATREELLALKDQYDAFNNNEMNGE